MGKKDLDDICERYLSKREDRDKVIEAVERCIKKGYDYEKLKDKILSAVADSHKANKVLSKVTDLYPQLRKRTRFEESKEVKESKSTRIADNDREREKDKERDRERERERKRDKEDKEKKRDEREKEKERTVEIEKEKLKALAKNILEKKQREELEKKNAVITEEQLKAKEMMYHAQQEIEERKRQIAALAGGKVGVPVQSNIGNQKVVLRPQEAAMFVNYSMEKKTRMEEIKARLAKSTGVLGNITALAQQRAGVSVESEPETEIHEEKPMVKTEAKEEELKDYMDPNIKMKSAYRSRRMFHFHEKGEFIKQANKERAKAKLEKLQAEISEAAKQTGISSAVKLAMVTPAGRSTETIPDIEWWDSIVLEKESYDDIPEESVVDRYCNTVSELVEHPIQLKPPTEPLAPQYLKVFLTKKEHKKIRRQNRKEAQKEKTEKIRLGLEKPPEPKVKLSNLMRVLGSDAVQDPTKMEAHVRKQMADRLRKHELENAGRKLTVEQKAMKKAKKISEDTSLAVHVAVYRVKSLAHPAKKFKVETNAKQLQMSGMMLLHKDFSVVVVEGGPKQQKFYKNLMLNRIKWSDEVIGNKKDAEKDDSGERNECKLIWEGQVKRRAFHDMMCTTATIQKQARDVFEKYHVAHYWDLCLSTTVLLEDENEH